MQQWTGFRTGNEVLLDLLLSEPHSIPPDKDCVRTEGTRVDSCYKEEQVALQLMIWLIRHQIISLLLTVASWLCEFNVVFSIYVLVWIYLRNLYKKKKICFTSGVVKVDIKIVVKRILLFFLLRNLNKLIQSPTGIFWWLRKSHRPFKFVDFFLLLFSVTCG